MNLNLQALLNSIVDAILTDDKTHNAQRTANSIIGQVVAGGGPGQLINELKGINWDASDEFYITNFDLLVESADDQIGAFGGHAVSKTMQILEKEHHHQSRRVSALITEISGGGSMIKPESLDRLSLTDPKVTLAQEYAALGCKVIERCLTIDIDSPRTGRYIKDAIEDDRDLDAFVDVRVLAEVSSFSVQIYFPASDTIFEAIMHALAGVRVMHANPRISMHTVEHVAPAIPGHKDIVDYKRIMELESVMASQRDSAERKMQTY